MKTKSLLSRFLKSVALAFVLLISASSLTLASVGHEFVIQYPDGSTAPLKGAVAHTVYLDLTDNDTTEKSYMNDTCNYNDTSGRITNGSQCTTSTSCGFASWMAPELLPNFKDTYQGLNGTPFDQFVSKIKSTTGLDYDANNIRGVKGAFWEGQIAQYCNQVGDAGSGCKRSDQSQFQIVSYQRPSQATIFNSNSLSQNNGTGYYPDSKKGPLDSLWKSGAGANNDWNIDGTTKKEMLFDNAGGNALHGNVKWVLKLPAPAANPTKPTITVNGCVNTDGTANPADFLTVTWSNSPTKIKVVNLSTDTGMPAGTTNKWDATTGKGYFWNKDVSGTDVTTLKIPSGGLTGWGAASGKSIPISPGKYYAYVWDGTKSAEADPVTVQACATTTPVAAPMCVSITMQDAGGNAINADRYPTLKANDQVYFRCGADVPNSVNSYKFRVIEVDSNGAGHELVLPSYPGSVSTAYTIPKAGKFVAQCAICYAHDPKNPTVVSCDAFENPGVTIASTAPATPLPPAAQEGCPANYSCVASAQCPIDRLDTTQDPNTGAFIPKYICADRSQACCRPAPASTPAGTAVPVPTVKPPTQVGNCPISQGYQCMDSTTCGGDITRVETTFDLNTGAITPKYKCDIIAQTCCKPVSTSTSTSTTTTQKSCQQLGGTCSSGTRGLCTGQPLVSNYSSSSCPSPNVCCIVSSGTNM